MAYREYRDYTIQSKPVNYKNTEFRSTLEGRWAVFFDAIGMDWVYEPEYFKLYPYYYLPDFLINGDLWVEVKPSRPNNQELRMTKALSDYTGNRVLILYNNVEDYATNLIYSKNTVYYNRIFYYKPGQIGLFSPDINDQVVKQGWAADHPALLNAYHMASEYSWPQK